MIDIEKYVDNFKTKYKEGFTSEEIEQVLKDFPNINLQKFDNALTGITCRMIDEKMIIYHCDIKTALRCGIENRDMRWHEFD